MRHGHQPITIRRCLPLDSAALFKKCRASLVSHLALSKEEVVDVIRQKLRHGIEGSQRDIIYTEEFFFRSMMLES
jgi:hypothetical protein